MSHMLLWFSRRPVTTALLAAAYFVAVVVSHDLVQELAYWLQRLYTREIWSPLVAGGAVAAAGIAGWRAARVFRNTGRPRVVSVLWWGSCLAALAASLSLLATNMEMIHFVQYAILAVPVVALTGRFGVTVLLVAGLGAFDELYQWVVLHPGWAVRYDVNDVVLNTIGAALGAAATAVWGGVRPAAGSDGRSLAVTWGPLLALALVIGAGGPALAANHRLAVHRDSWCPHTWITLCRAQTPQLGWQAPENARRHYVLHPGPALALCLLLAGGFCWMDGRYRPAPTAEPDTA